MKTKNDSILVILMLMGLTFMIGAITQNWVSGSESITIEAKETPDSIIPTDVSESLVESTTQSETPRFDNEIEEYIYKTFGEDYEKAILLLRGVDGVCGGENRGLRPEAVNTNKDGSKDFNIFQVNDHFHPVYELNLDTDWKANIDYAKRMFDRDGKTFSERWTAGKCLRDNGFDI